MAYGRRARGNLIEELKRDQMHSRDIVAALDFRDGLRVVTLKKLLEFKIASGVWGHRAQDLVDVQKLIRFNRLEESFANELPESLRAKFVELLEASRLERELEE